MADAPVTLFVAGDVMTGRGVDQIQRHPSPPELHEPYVKDARDYVRLAEDVCGAVPRAVDPAYIWGEALDEWDRRAPAARIVNLETSITRSGKYDARKGIHYRMHPANIACITAARFDVCVLANNHVLDFDRAGLVETLETLERHGVLAAGAGRSLADASRPAVLPLRGGGRLAVGAWGHESSGVPDDWAASTDEPGVHVLRDLSGERAGAAAAVLAGTKRAGDIAVASIHWGGNWGYDVPSAHVDFALRLIDGGVDLVHGHSSHHVRPMEIYRGRLILYGCGDFINDYEGITGYERYRDDLTLMFFPVLDAASGRLLSLDLVPMQIRRLRLNRASAEDARWVRDTLNRITAPFGAGASLTAGGALAVDAG